MTESSEMAPSAARSCSSRPMSRSIARRFAHTSTRFFSFWNPNREDAMAKYAPATTANTSRPVRENMS